MFDKKLPTTETPEQQKNLEASRVDNAVKGVHAVESMNLEIAALRRQVSQQTSTINSIRTEHQTSLDTVDRLRFERDHYMTQVIEIRTHLETAAASVNLAFSKAKTSPTRNFSSGIDYKKVAEQFKPKLETPKDPKKPEPKGTSK